MRYVCVEALNLAEFSNKINDLLEEGFVPVGGLVVVGPKGHLLQGMMRGAASALAENHAAVCESYALDMKEANAQARDYEEIITGLKHRIEFLENNPLTSRTV